jgi:hypothetical protein
MRKIHVKLSEILSDFNQMNLISRKKFFEKLAKEQLQLHHCNSLEKGMIAELLSHQMNF